MTAIYEAEGWLQDILSNDTALAALVDDRIYGYLAPEAVDYPLVTFKYLVGEDENGTGVTRLFSRMEYQVCAYETAESFEDLNAIADAIDAVLHAVQGTTPDGGYVVDCVRLRPVASVEPLEGGLQMRQLGGVYQIRLQEA